MQSPRKRNLSQEEFKEWFYSNVTKLDNGCWEWNKCRGVQGYGVVRIGGKNIRANRLSLEFKLNRKIQDNLLACHICNNPPCCNPDHLKEGTLQENMDDKIKAGRQPRGEENGNSKLTKEQVILIRSLKGKKPTKEIAEEFGVKPPCIQKILRGDKWAHVK